MRIFIYIFLLTFAHNGLATGRDFGKVDRYARSIKKDKDYIKLAKELAAPFELEIDKVRAIYIWISHNIEYDVNRHRANMHGKGSIRIRGRNKKEILQKKRKIRLNKAKKAYKSGKGVCEDYSLLFSEMCKAVGLKTAYITGFAKYSPKDIGKMPKKSNHAWNAVKINGVWKLVDVTWAAGEINLKTGLFKKDFIDFFFLTDPDKFILNHFPDNPKWQLKSKKMSKKQFAQLPFIHLDYYKYKVKNFLPHGGLISSRKNKGFITLEFENNVPDIGLYINNKILTPKTIIENNKIKIKIPKSIHRNQKIVLGVLEKRTFLPLVEYKTI